jgi:hypothetical protein
VEVLICLEEMEQARPVEAAQDREEDRVQEEEEGEEWGDREQERDREVTAFARPAEPRFRINWELPASA